jgi:hypothetical protein
MSATLFDRDGGMPQTPSVSNHAIHPGGGSLHEHDVAVTTPPPNRHGAESKPIDGPDPFANVKSAEGLPNPTRPKAKSSGRWSLQNSCSWKKSIAVGGLFGVSTGAIGAALIAGTAKGALVGAAIGSAIPGVGTAVGAVIGAFGGTTAAIIATGALGGILTGLVAGPATKGAYKLGSWVKKTWRDWRTVNASAPHNAAPHDRAASESAAALAPSNVDNVSCSPDFAQWVEDRINQRAEDHGDSLKNNDGALPRRMQKDLGRMHITLDGKTIVDLQSSNEMESSVHVAANVQQDPNLRFACSVLNQGLFRAVIEAMGETCKPPENPLLPRPDNPLGFKGIPQGMPQVANWIDQQIQHVQQQLVGGGGDKEEALQQQLQELQQLGYHVDLQTSADGKYRFTVRSAIPLPGVSVADSVRGMQNIAADPLQSRFAYEITGEFDPAKPNSPVRIDQGSPKVTLKFVKEKGEQNPAVDPADVPPGWFESGIKKAVMLSGVAIIFNGKLIKRLPTATEGRFRDWGLRAMTRHELAARQELGAPLSDGDDPSPWETDLLNHAATMLANEFPKIEEARTSTTNLLRQRELVTKRAEQLLLQIQRNPPDQESIVEAAVSLLVISRLFTISKVGIGLRSGRGKVPDEAEYLEDLSKCMTQARVNCQVRDPLRWEDRSATAKQFKKPANPVHGLLVRLAQLSVRQDDQDVESAMYRQLGRTVQLACETFSLSSPTAEEHPLDDTWRKLQAGAASADRPRRQQDLETANNLLLHVPTAHAHFLACDYVFGGRGTE